MCSVVSEKETENRCFSQRVKLLDIGRRTAELVFRSEHIGTNVLSRVIALLRSEIRRGKESEMIYMENGDIH